MVETKKLKILCLHGYNNNAETMKFMTEGVTAMMRDIADFYYLDGPFEVNAATDPGEPGLLKRGFKGPFNKWFYQTQKTPEVQSLLDNYTKSHPINGEFPEYIAYEGIQKSVEAILQISKEHGPFDGILSFSQGAAMFRNLYLLTQILKKEYYNDFQFPKFIVSFSGAVFRNYIILIEKQLYGAFDFSISGINSLHICGRQDPLYKNTKREPQCYKNGHQVILEHGEGHKVLKKFTPEQFYQIESFIKREFLNKFGSDKGFIMHNFTQDQAKL